MEKIEIIKKLLDLIASGRTDEVLGRMRDIMEDSYYSDDIFLYSSRFRKNEEEYRRGVMDISDYRIEVNKIDLGLIKIIKQYSKDLESQKTYLPKKSKLTISREFKKLGNLRTKMIPIYPYIPEYPLKIENVILDYYPEKIYSKENYPQFYQKVKNYISSKKTIYNEAKPHLLNYKLKNNEEENQYFLEMELGICGYIDFLSISRNLDSEFKQYDEITTIRSELKRKGVDKDPRSNENNVPKQLGVSCIAITKDGYVVLQKRQRAEVASQMYHLTIAEGLQAYPSYDQFISLDESLRLSKITDKSIKGALYRGLLEELGIESSDVGQVELLSIYFDTELQQPIFQTVAKLNMSMLELKKYFQSSKGRDTISEINQIEFVEHNPHECIGYFQDTLEKGRWSTHAVIGLISFFERFYNSDGKIEDRINAKFDKPVEFSLGEQQYVKII